MVARTDLQPEGKIVMDGVNAEMDLVSRVVDLFSEFVHCQNQKDLPGIQQCLHEGSVAAAVLLRNFEKMFDRFTLDIRIRATHFVGSEGDYAYCRVEQTIEKVTGPELANTEVENLAVFRRDHGAWKLWQCVPLVMRPL